MWSKFWIELVFEEVLQFLVLRSSGKLRRVER